MYDVPNLYSFATKELDQDATLAYILAWAKPAYRESHPPSPPARYRHATRASRLEDRRSRRSDRHISRCGDAE